MNTTTRASETRIGMTEDRAVQTVQEWIDGNRRDVFATQRAINALMALVSVLPTEK